MSRRSEVPHPIEELSDLRSPEGCLITLYLEHRSQGIEATTSDLLKPIRQEAERLSDRKAILSIRSDVERISEAVKSLRADPAPAHVFFASHVNGVFRRYPLAEPVGSQSGIGRRPFLRPLRAMTPLCRTAVAVVERASGRLYLVVGSEVSEVGVFESEIGKSNWGGFRGYEEHRVRQATDQAISRMMKEISDRMLALHQEIPLDLVVLSGHSESIEAMVPYMHSYLKEVPRKSFVSDPHTLSLAEVRDHARAAVAELKRERDQELVEALFSGIAQGVPGAQGVAEVLRAVNARAVDHLLIERDFTSPGNLCPGCGLLEFAEEKCPLCDVDMDEISDILDVAAEEIVAAGGAVDQVGKGSKLDPFGAVAALRFPM